MLQQLEAPHDGTLSVNDCFRPVSRYFDRIERPEQLVPAALEAMRVLTDPAETGAVTLALPEDVQAEAFDVPAAFLEPRVWTIYRQPPAPEALARAAELVRGARRPLIVAGGGVIYSEATAALRAFADATGIPVAETQAGRGALASDHPLALGAIGATGTAAANRLAARGRPGDRDRHALERLHDRLEVGLPGPGRALRQRQRRRLRRRQARRRCRSWPTRAWRSMQLREALAGHRADGDWERRAAEESAAWAAEVARLVAPARAARCPTQAAVIGAINDAAGETGVVVCAAGSMPGDLHKLWRARDPTGKGYHVEYGYSCMGYEIPGGMGVKLAAPEREVFVMVGDGSYLMLPGRARDRGGASGSPIVIVLVDNHGYASIGALSRSVGGGRLRHALPAAPNGALPVDAPDGAGRSSRCSRCRSTSRRTPRASARGSSARVHRRSCARRSPRRARRRRAGRRSTSRSTATRGVPELRGLVGRAGRRGLRRGERCRRARDGYERDRAAQRS